MPRPVRSEATLPVRFVWPFARTLAPDVRAHGLLERFGVPLTVLGDPAGRILHRVVMQILEAAVEAVEDPALGLRAGTQVDPGDFDVLEYAARAAPTLGDTLQMMCRYSRLMHGAAENTILVEGAHAVWRHRVDVPQHPAANDFTVAAGIAFSNRNVSVVERPLEIHLTHDRPAYAAEYEKYLGLTPRFGMPCNAVVMRRERLLVPMLRASSDLVVAFEAQAERMLQSVETPEGLEGKVRAALADLLPSGSATVPETARRLAMSATTLRRRLEEEGTTFSAIVEQLRRELAEQHLARPGTNVSEVAFLLGFSDVRAFGRAFRRWTGKTPTEYRGRRSGGP